MTKQHIDRRVRTQAWPSALIVVVLLIAAWPAHAVALLWTIDSPLVLDSGATVVGSFVYDAGSNQYSNVNLSLSGSSADGLYDEPLSGGPLNSGLILASIEPTGGSLTGVSNLGIKFTAVLTDAGGTVAILNVGLSTCDNSNCTDQTFHPTDSASIFNGDIGTLTASPVPVPAALWLFGSALGLLGWARRRKVG